MQDRETHCAICETEMTIGHPPLDDPGSLDDDPELVCTACGSAVISAPLTGRLWWRPRGARIAPQQRRAA